MSKNIFCGSLAWATTSESLEAAFAAYGTVTSAKVITDRETGRSKGFGFVEMADGGDEAIEALNGSDLDGRTIVGHDFFGRAWMVKIEPACDGDLNVSGMVNTVDLLQLLSA